ncbi:MAG: M67 family metallopeptidase [Anaerolineaceae bacterium]|nr:M67 family metallopeptidase [Anaerolineaceae bacterium]
MDKLIIPVDISMKVLYHVNEKFPEESCGLLAGFDNKVTIELPITNQLHSPIKYFMDPMELFKALEKIETLKLDLLGIFHSHPKGPPNPSETDIKEFLYPGVATIICYPESNEWKMKAFLIENGCYTEIELVMF